MKRTIKFENSVKHKRYFKLIYTGFRAWASSEDNTRKRDKKSRAAEAEIMRELESISEPIGESPSDDEFDFRDRRLREGDITLSGTAYSLLKDRLEDAPMRLEVVIEQEEMLDWLRGSAREIKEETKE